MKIRRSAVSLVIAAGFGFVVGWFCKPKPATPSAGGGKISAPHSEFNPASGAISSARSQESSSSSPSENAIEARFATDLKSLRRLSDTEFANHMADAWFARREDSENLLSRALFAEACDSGKAKAFYDEFKRRKGISNDQDGGAAIRDFLTMSGKRFGAELTQKLLETNPAGTREMDSLVHGWVTVEPTQAVEWLNSLPEDCPFYSRSLQGIVFGIGEVSPASAADTFLKLPEEERNKKFEYLAGGIIRTHGFAGINEIATHFPNPIDRANLLESSLPYAMEMPPADFINGMADHIHSEQKLKDSFQIMAGRWVTTSPVDAIAWLDKNADNAGQAPALTIMASQLAQSGRADAVNSWLAAHPQSPARAAVEGRQQSGNK